MLTAQSITEKLNESVDSRIKTYPVRNLSASRLGHPCERYLYLLLTQWQELKPHDRGLQQIFDLGNSIEEYAIKQLKEAGFEVVTPTVRAWQIDKPFITGREDVRIKDDNGELIPCEIKGLQPYEFDKLNCIEDFFNSKRAYVRGYPAQLFVYMYHFCKEKGFFVLVNKLNGQIKVIEVSLDYEFGEACLSKAERVYKAVEERKAPAPCEDYTICENCNLQHVCGLVRRAQADIECSDELESLIDRKNELKEAVNEYDECDKQIKKLVGDREKVITGSYLIERKLTTRKAFTVPESTSYRMSIKRL